MNRSRVELSPKHIDCGGGPVKLVEPMYTAITMATRTLLHMLPRQADFERLAAVWDAARIKHQRLLRPALGLADRREELNELLAVERKRATETIAAIVAFRRHLVEEEAVAAKKRARRVADCYMGIVAILDRYQKGDRA